jgi:hypothetical protein
MVMSINKLMLPEGVALYYSEAWMRLIESHMTYLRQVSANNLVEVEPHLAYKFEGDLYGLLNHLKVRPEYHWLTMRVNDMASPSELNSDRQTLVLPNFEIVEKLRQVFQTTSKKIN